MPIDHSRNEFKFPNNFVTEHISFEPLMVFRESLASLENPFNSISKIGSTFYSRRNNFGNLFVDLDNVQKKLFTLVEDLSKTKTENANFKRFFNTFVETADVKFFLDNTVAMLNRSLDSTSLKLLSDKASKKDLSQVDIHKIREQVQLRLEGLEKALGIFYSDEFKSKISYQEAPAYSELDKFKEYLSSINKSFSPKK